MNLYVSDLDGTLLNAKGEVSDFTKSELNKLISDNINFTIATARTPATVVDILDGINLKLPVVLMNGVLLYDIKGEKYIEVKEVDEETTKKVLGVFESEERDPFVYGIKEDFLYVYYKNLYNPNQIKFYEERCNRKLKTFIKREDYDIAKEHQIINFVLCDELEVIERLYSKLKNIKGLTTNYYKDVYDEKYYFLESYSSEASKANGVKRVGDYIKYSKMICFGDQINDIPMFRIADEGYALENGADKLKEIATKVIGKNINDSVVKFIKKHYKNIEIH